MVADPCEYTWSSHRYHGAGHADPILDSFPEWEQLGRTEPERRARWRRKVRGEQPVKELDAVRSSLRSGRPYGAEDWVEVISRRLGIVREPRRRGRPPREKMLRHRNSSQRRMRRYCREEIATPRRSDHTLGSEGFLPKPRLLVQTDPRYDNPCEERTLPMEHEMPAAHLAADLLVIFGA